MGVKLEIRNPKDLTDTYDQIEIQRSTTNTVAGMADIKTDLEIDSSNTTDLSQGFTVYTDSDGDVDTHFYRFRYKVSGSGATSAYSDIFQAGTTILHTRFRRAMRDINSNDYYFLNTDIDGFLEHAISSLFPHTWYEKYSDSAFTSTGTAEIFTFPTDMNRLTELEAIDSEGRSQGQILGWEVRGRKLLFKEAPPSGTTIRAWYESRFQKLSEVPSMWDKHLLNVMRLQAYETMEADRSKYYKYQSTVNPEGGNLPSLDRVVGRIEQQVRLRLNELRRVRKPASINLTS